MKNPKLVEFRNQAVAKARDAGLPAYFLDECGPGVIRVLPDGRKEHILVQQGMPPKVQPFECRC